MTRIPSKKAKNVSDSPTDDPVRRLARARAGRVFATCAVRESPGGVTRLLRSKDARAFEFSVRKLEPAFTSCASMAQQYAITFKRNGLLGLLADAWFRQNGVPALAPAPYDPSTAVLDPSDDDAGAIATLHMATCLSLTEPTASARLLRAAPESSEETAAFAALAPLLTKCLGKNVTLQASRSSVRTSLAFATYHRTIDAAASAASPAQSNVLKTAPRD